MHRGIFLLGICFDRRSRLVGSTKTIEGHQVTKHNKHQPPVLTIWFELAVLTPWFETDTDGLEGVSQLAEAHSVLVNSVVVFQLVLDRFAAKYFTRFVSWTISLASCYKEMKRCTRVFWHTVWVSSFPRLPQCPSKRKRAKSEPTGRNFGRITVLLEHFRCYNEMKPL